MNMNKAKMQHKEIVVNDVQTSSSIAFGVSCEATPLGASDGSMCHLEHSSRSDVRAKRSFAHTHAGFTLIEVMVVIVILGVLAALIVPNVMGRGEKAKVDTSAITLKGVAGALDQYKLDNGKYPSMQDGGLDALVNQPASAKNWMPGGYVKGGYPKDSWDNDIQYVIPGAEGRAFDLYSFGADGKEGGEGTDADIYYQP
jgi:general secretion pathway protein G